MKVIVWAIIDLHTLDGTVVVAIDFGIAFDGLKQATETTLHVANPTDIKNSNVFSIPHQLFDIKLNQISLLFRLNQKFRVKSGNEIKHPSVTV